MDELVEVDVEHVVGGSAGDRVAEGHGRLPEADRAVFKVDEPDPWDGIAPVGALPPEGDDRGLGREAQVPEAVLSRSVLVDVRARQASAPDRAVVPDLGVAESSARRALRAGGPLLVPAEELLAVGTGLAGLGVDHLQRALVALAGADRAVRRGDGGVRHSCCDHGECRNDQDDLLEVHCHCPLVSCLSAWSRGCAAYANWAQNAASSASGMPITTRRNSSSPTVP